MAGGRDDTGGGAGTVRSAPALDEDTLRALWGLPPVAIAIISGEGRIRAVNPSFARLVSRMPEDVAGRTLVEVAPFAAAVAAEYLRGVSAGGPPVYGVDGNYQFADIVLDLVSTKPGVAGADVVVVATLSSGRPTQHLDKAATNRSLFFDVARRLAHAPIDGAKAAIEEALQMACEVFHIDRAYVRELNEDETHFEITCEFMGPGLPPAAYRSVRGESFDWARGRFLAGEAVVAESLADLPPEATDLRAGLAAMGASSTVGVPMLDGTRLLGYVAYADRKRSWSSGDVARLRLIGELISTVIARGRAERALKARLDFEQLLSAAIARFIDIGPEDVGAEIDRTLAAVGVARSLDRAYLLQVDPSGDVSMTNEWCALGVPPLREKFGTRSLANLSPLTRRTLAGEVIHVNDADAPEGSDAAELLRRTGVRACTMLPVVVEGRISALIAFQTIARRIRPTREIIARGRLIGDVVAHALSRREVTERLHRSERRFSQIIRSAMDGAVLVDARGIVREYNPAASAVLGRPREAMIGQDLGIAVREADRPTLAAHIARLAEGADAAPERFELTAEHPDGAVTPIELSMTRLDAREEIVLAAFIRDITDRKRAEAERQRAFDEVSRQKRSLEHERDYLREERGDATQEVIGESAKIRGALDLVTAVADTSASVILFGESGVGKEVFARAIHQKSSRRDGPLVKVNCASVPTALFESEFFGHVKGSFTGALKDRIGRFELANGGTIFLDEVGEIPVDQQAKLLRVLQEGEIERVGDERVRRVDVRIISATNRDLELDCAAGRFRRDLYFRLGVFPIVIPPLRDRGNDVIVLAKHFLRRKRSRCQGEELTLTPADEARLRAYDWPGNVRELEHVLERAVILSRGSALRLDLALPEAPGRAPAAPGELLRDDDLRRLERENLVLALKTAGGRIAGPGGAAELVGVSPSTLRDRMKAFGIRARG